MYTVYTNEQEITTSWSNWKFLSLAFWHISVLFEKVSCNHVWLEIILRQ